VQFDNQKIRYISILNKTDGKRIARVLYSKLDIDPDLIDGFITSVIIFAKTPISTISKGPHNSIIETGETCIAFILSDPVLDETPYRERLRWIIEFIEGKSIPKNQQRLLNLISLIQKKTPYWIEHYLFQNLLSSLGLSWIGFLDGPPIEHIEYVVPRINQPFFSDEIQKYLIGKLIQQIDEHGTTINLDIPTATKHVEIAKRIDQVLLMRKREIEKIEVIIEFHSVNLKNLWLTSYGFSALEAECVSTSCSLETFNQIKKEFEKNDISIKIAPSASRKYQSRMSAGLREYIWKLADSNRNSNPLLSLFIELVTML